MNNFENLKNIVDGIVKNEFQHVQETLAVDFENENLGYKQAVLMTNEIRETLKNMQQKSSKD